MILAWNHEKDAMYFFFDAKNSLFRPPTFCFNTSQICDPGWGSLNNEIEFSWWLQTLQETIATNVQFAICSHIKASIKNYLLPCHMCFFDFFPQTSDLERAHIRCVAILFWHKLLAIFMWRFLLPNADSASMLKLSLVLKNLYPCYIHIRISKGDSGKRCPSGVEKRSVDCTVGPNELISNLPWIAGLNMPSQLDTTKAYSGKDLFHSWPF